MNNYVNTKSKTGVKGEGNGNAKTCAETVTALRLKWLRGASEKALAVEFKMSTSNVCKIVSNQTWRHAPWPDFPLERFEREILGVGRAVVAALVMQAAFVSFVAADLLAPGSILRALWERRFWAARRRERQLLHALDTLEKPEPPQPPSAPASSEGGCRDSGDEQPEQWPARPLFGMPPVYPKPLRDWKEPRELRNQAVPVKSGDRAWNDPDVLAIRGTKRFQVIIGGRPDGGERRQA